MDSRSQEWSISPYFTLIPQTSSGLINRLRLQAMLIDELLNDGYDFVLTVRLQSDPIQRRFSQNRQMSGGRFLVSLREVLNTADFILSLTNKEGYKLLERGPTT